MTHQAAHKRTPIPEFEAKHPEFGGRMYWIRKRSKPVKFTRRDKATGKRIVEDLKPNGYAAAFVKIAGRLYVDETEFWRIVAEKNGGADDAR